MAYTPRDHHGSSLPFETHDMIHGKPLKIPQDEAALANQLRSTTLAKASVQALGNRKTPGEWFTLVTGFICIVCIWGLIDTVVEIISGDSLAMMCYTYIIFSAVGLALLMVYKKFFDNSYDPSSMLAM